MSFTLLRAPVGAGKTRAIIDRINAVYDAHPLARVWVVLPTARQTYALRQRLIDEGTAGRAPLFNLELFNFYALYERILLAAKTPTYTVRGMARPLLLRHVAGQALADRPDGLFAPIARTLGFAQLVGSLIDELKSARVEPHQFEAVAETPKDRELAAVYTAYQTLLRQGAFASVGRNDGTPLVDSEGEGWLALDVLDGTPGAVPKLGLLAVDGFDQLTTVQADLIHALAARADETVVTLSQMPERVGQRVAQAERLLLRGGDVVVQDLPPRPFASRALGHVVAQAFREQPDRIPLEGGAVMFIEAADPAAESREVMRQVKRCLVGDDACAPEDIMVAVRDWPTYSTPLAAAAREFGVPLAAHHGQPLTDHPFGAFIDGLLRLADDDFPLRDVVDVLYSPYVALGDDNPLSPALIERIGLRAEVLGGESAWLAAIEAAAQVNYDDMGVEQPALIQPDEVEPLQEALLALFHALTLPERATLHYYVQKVEEWLGNDEPLPGERSPDAADEPEVPLDYSLNTIAALRSSGSDEAARDLDAVRAFKSALRQLFNAHELVCWATDAQRDATLLREAFITDLRAAMASVSLAEPSSRTGRVLLTLVTDARGLPHQHLFIMGLSEGLFPAKTSDDPLYLDSERAALSTRLRDSYGHPGALRQRAERAGDDSIFFELIGLPRQSLTLSRPYIQNGGPWPASYLWRAVESVFSDIPAANRIRIRPGHISPVESAATLAELTLALAHDPDAPGSQQAAAYLAAHRPDALDHLRHVRSVEVDRMRPDLAWDAYSGMLSDTPWADEVAQRFGENYQWSVSGLEAFGASPYRFFAQRVLKLDEWEEPDESLDVALLGTVIHHVLYHVYSHLMRRGIPVHPSRADEALAVAAPVVAEELAQAPESLHFPNSPFWRLERTSLERRILAFIASDYAAENALTAAFPALAAVERWPLLREWKFERVPVMLPNETTIHMRGTFDRVDVAQIGGSLVFVLMDYKSGTTPYKPDDFISGRKVQMPLYMRVMGQLLSSGALNATLRAHGLDLSQPTAVVGGLYWGVAGDNPALFAVSAADEVNSAVLDKVAGFVADIRAGRFIPFASKVDDGKCFAYCAFHDLCRVCDLRLEKSDPS